MSTLALLFGSVTPAMALTVNFRARFTNLDASVTKADLKAAIPGGTPAIVAPNVHTTPSTCPTDTGNKCADFTLTLARSDTRQFTLCVENALQEVACSNAVTFQMPAAPVAPSLSIQVLSFN